MDESAERAAGDGQAARSVQAILRNQSPNGAIVASPDFSQYQFCWLRDGSFSAFALDVAGEHEASGRYHRWVQSAVDQIGDVIVDAINRHQSGRPVDVMAMPPARFTLDGSVVVDGWPNFQVDGYGTWLWSLGRHVEAAVSDELPENLRATVGLIGRYLETFAESPCYDVWEENGTAVHTSTLASVYGGLVSASEILGDPRFLEAAVSVKANIERAGARRGYFNKSSESDDVDASALWLDQPFHVVGSGDPVLAETVKMISSNLDLDGGLRRYPSDTYFGGGAWPVLTASLGWHFATAGDARAAQGCLDWVSERVDARGRLGEQFGGDHRDRRHFDEWVDRWGPSAVDLTWSHAMLVILADANSRVTQVAAPEIEPTPAIARANEPGVTS